MSNNRETGWETIRRPTIGRQAETQGRQGGDTYSQHMGDQTAPSEGAVGHHAHEWIRTSDIEYQCNQCNQITDRDGNQMLPAHQIRRDNQDYYDRIDPDRRRFRFDE